jgi:hypothetical protein
MNSRPCEDNLSARANRFHPFVSLFETGRVDGTQVFSERRSQTTAVYHCRNSAEEFVPLNHVRGLVLRARKHEPRSSMRFPLSASPTRIYDPHPFGP